MGGAQRLQRQTRGNRSPWRIRCLRGTGSPWRFSSAYATKGSFQALLHEATNSRQLWRGDMATSFSASHEKATNSRKPWRGYTATCLFASHGGYKFGASLGEATYYFALAFLGKALERQVSFPLFASYRSCFLKSFGRKSFF